MTSLKVMISRIMQTRFIMDVPAWPIIFIIAFSPFLCRAHSRDIHKKISESAALSSDGFKSFLNDYFEVQGTPSLARLSLLGEDKAVSV